MRRAAEQGSGAESQYIVINELKPEAGKKGDIIAILEKLLQTGTNEFLSFAVLDRGDLVDADTGKLDEALYVFLRFQSKVVFDKLIKDEATQDTYGFEEAWDEIEGRCEWRRKTTWRACGIGFIGLR